MGYPVPVTEISLDMTTSLTRPRTILGVAILVAILAAGAYAFTASNTIPASSAGSGSGAVSGYTASNIAYTLNATDPTTADEITFDLTPTSTSAVKVKYTNAGSWTTCTNDGSGGITCDYTGSPIALTAIDNLTVVAVD
jgi:hypothetical protein